MDIAFKDQSLDRLEIDASYSAGFGDGIVRVYRKAILHIRSATDERTFYSGDLFGSKSF